MFKSETVAMNGTRAQEPYRLAVLLGGTKEGRSGRAAADWFIGRAWERPDFILDVIDPVGSEIPLVHTRSPAAGEAEKIAAARERIEGADAFVVVTPEFNHSFPAPLKALIDWFYTEWHAKPVGFVSYGGMSGGLRAVEQLRLVFAELHAVSVRDTVSFHNVQERFDAHGRPVEPGGCNAAAKVMLDQLLWWAQALRTARSTRPYGG